MGTTAGGDPIRPGATSEGPAKDPRSFEPPPWEREQFEELARRRAEREALDAAGRQAQEETERAAAARAAETATSAAPGPEAGPEAPAAREAEPPVAVAPAEGAEAADAAVMLMGLAAQEPRAFAWAWLVWLAAAGLFVLLGVVALVFAAVGLARARGSGMATTWSFVLMVAGLASLGAAVWLTARALKERGA